MSGDLIAGLVLLVALALAVGLCVHRFAWREYMVTVPLFPDGPPIPLARVKVRPWRNLRMVNVSDGRVFGSRSRVQDD